MYKKCQTYDKLCIVTVIVNKKIVFQCHDNSFFYALNGKWLEDNVLENN